MSDSLDRSWIESMQSQGYAQDQIDAMVAASYSAQQLIEQHNKTGVPDQLTAVTAFNFAQFLETCGEGQIRVTFPNLHDSSTWEFKPRTSQ